MRSYTLTASEASDYDSEDDRRIDDLNRSLGARFSGTDTEVYYPGECGFVINNYPLDDDDPC